MKRTRSRSALLLLATLLALSRPAFCQTFNATDMGALLRGDQTPLTHKLSDLNGTWRRFSTGSSTDVSQFYLGLMTGMGSNDAFYTQGRTETFGGETYLIAYRRQMPPLDMAALMRAGSSQNQPKPIPLTPDTVLSLSLLNLRTTGSLDDIRAFDMPQEISASRQTASLMGDVGVGDTTVTTATTEPASVSNLKQLGLGLMQYVQDWDETLPSMKDAATVKTALLPYVKNEQLFMQPDTKRPYRPNASLSKRSLASFDNPATMVVLYEDAPEPDNTRAVAFLDGHVKRVPESEWPRLKSASHVPGP